MIFRHYKGAYYRLLFYAHDSTNETAGRDLAVYVSLGTGQINVRSAEEFQQLVDVGGVRVPRFQWVRG